MIDDVSKAIVVDFETFYSADYTLRKMRTEEYINDKRFQVHGMAVAYPGGRTDWVQEKHIDKWLYKHRKAPLVAHNMYFDGLILNLKYDHVAPLMLDTRLMANAVFGPSEISGGNSLEAVAERFGLQPKGKIEAFEGIRSESLTAEEWQALKLYATNDADLEYKILHKMLPLLNRQRFELWLIDHTLRLYLCRPLIVSRKTATAAIAKVRARMEDCMRALPKMKFDYSYQKPYQKDGAKLKREVVVTKDVDESVLASNPQFSQLLLQTLAKHSAKVPMKRGKNGMIPALAKMDEGFLALSSCPIPQVRKLVAARLAKRSGDTQIARLQSLLTASKFGGFRIYLNYCGARTGRWSGGSGLNPQNFPSPARSTDDFEREVAQLIRDAVRCPRGMKFVAVDAANIEARVLAWWAAQDDLVQAFGAGIDVYSEFASGTFGEEVRKPKDTDSKKAAARFKLLRAAGKEAILGLGYSMSATKMEARMRGRPDVSPLFESGDLNTERCIAIVDAYRKRYSKIPALWRKTEHAFHTAVAGVAVSVGKVLFSPLRETGRSGVEVHLPSGRRLRYRDVRVGEHNDRVTSTRKQWVYGAGKGSKLYGGLLVENIVQAIARDILAEAIYLMESEGFWVAYHVHDSICMVVPSGTAKAALKRCSDALSEAPLWGQGMLLGAEGEISDSFI